MSEKSVTIVKIPDENYLWRNCIIADPSVGLTKYVKIGNNLFSVQIAPVGNGTICVPAVARAWSNIAFGPGIVKAVDNIPGRVDMIEFKMRYMSLKSPKLVEDVSKSNLISLFMNLHQNFVISRVGQELMLKYSDIIFVLTVVDLKVIDANGNPMHSYTSGIIHKNSKINFVLSENMGFILSDDEVTRSTKSFFKASFDFKSIGVGGVGKEFEQIFRRAFATRICSEEARKLKVQHVKGILLYGPPGTGKTLLARQIGKMLNTVEPKIVNGPEVLDKYVGGSEAKIRALFADAEKDQASLGYKSPLHLIVFDEIDAICTTRGSGNDNSGVKASIVNQLLSKIDGINQLNNILLVGMTNRKDLIDPALLRPGRFELQVEISLPDEKGRQEILSIHTAHLSENKQVRGDFNLEEISKLTNNYSGAELEAVVRCTVSNVLNSYIDTESMRVQIKDGEKIMFGQRDFIDAIKNIKPAFGVEEDTFAPYIGDHFINSWSDLNDISNRILQLVLSVKENKRMRLTSILLTGEKGVGKTTLAAKLAVDSKVPFTRLLAADSMVGYSTMGRSAKIYETFEEAYKSKMSLVVIDNIDNFIEYSMVGTRFTSSIFNTIRAMVGKLPPNDHQLIIIGTCNTETAHTLDLVNDFRYSYIVPKLTAKAVKQMIESENILEFVLNSATASVNIPMLVEGLDLSMQVFLDMVYISGENADTLIELLTVYSTSK